MSDDKSSLLSRLLGRGKDDQGPDPWTQLAPSQPQHQVAGPAKIDALAAEKSHVALAEDGQPVPEAESEAQLSVLLDRINNIVGGPATRTPGRPAEDQVRERLGKVTVVPGEVPPSSGEEFVPLEPSTLAAADLTETMVEGLVLKYLLGRGSATGRGISDQVKLPFRIIEEILRQMKTDQLVVYKSTAPMNDYDYLITELGRERGRRLAAECTYYGAAPVALADYVAGVRAQSIATQHPTDDHLHEAFEDLLLNREMLDRLGPAINSGRGLFLYGAPGNGKTSIAERISRAFGPYIWIPRALGIDGEIVRLYDPVNHERAPQIESNGVLDTSKIDKRWIRIRRPTIVVGGELTMENLEITHSTVTGISEAPLQLKSNCGTLVIDDFGRQRMSTHQLLNRWIVPLEKRYDFLNLANGKKIQVPFDQLIIFSTNLEPRDLCDDAFLRRIPYKIDVHDPSEAEFRELFRMMCEVLQVEHRPAPIEYLIQEHYRKVNRNFRCCQPRDLILQVKNLCLYRKQPPELTNANFDFAVANYFAVM